jgi:cobalamin biosynthesis protein CobD/CbiB
MKYKTGILAGLLVLIICAFIAWMCGYNFDTRNAIVGIWTGFSFLVSCFAGALVYDMCSDCKQGE